MHHLRPLPAAGPVFDVVAPDFQAMRPAPALDHPDAVGREVLAIVSALVAELGGAAAGRSAELDDSLERDFGLGSLERVELLVRLEHAFGIRLADEVMAEAATPRNLGSPADGELFITGRRQDMILKAGRNLRPQEVEEVVGDLERIRKGCVAAFGIPDPEAGTERLVVVAETRETAPERLEALRAAVVDRVVAVLGVPPDVVEIRSPGTVLETSSGKIRRAATREHYRSGKLTGGRRPLALPIFANQPTLPMWAR